MLRILFCNIAWMDYYKGIVPGKDEPKGGGSYVKENLDAHEKYNFDIVFLSKDAGYPEGEYCLGFVETKSTKGVIITPNVVNTISVLPSILICSGDMPNSSCVSRNAVSRGVSLFSFLPPGKLMSPG